MNLSWIKTFTMRKELDLGNAKEEETIEIINVLPPHTLGLCIVGFVSVWFVFFYVGKMALVFWPYAQHMASWGLYRGKICQTLWPYWPGEAEDSSGRLVERSTGCGTPLLDKAREISCKGI